MFVVVVFVALCASSAVVCVCVCVCVCGSFARFAAETLGTDMAAGWSVLLRSYPAGIQEAV